jgi:hypothetical protein
MPTSGLVGDQGNKWKDYVLYLLRRQSRSRTVFLALVAMALLVKIVALPSAHTLVSAILGAAIAVVAAIEAWEQVQRYRFAEHATIKRLTEIEVGQETRISFDQLLPSRKQATLGFSARYSGADRVFASESLDRELISRDWRISVDSEKPARVAALVRQHRDHALAFLAVQLRGTSKTDALLVNEDKLCLGDELSDDSVRGYRGSYFDSLCTNEACTAILTSGHRSSRPYHGRPLFPVALDVAGYFLEDLHDADVNNHIGVSTLAVTADHHIVVWQQTSKNIQDPGKIISTGSGSCDFSDLKLSSLRQTIVSAMERELREETKVHVPDRVTVERQRFVKSTTLIGFFRWLQRGGKPEFIGISQLSVDLAVLRPDGFEVAAITGYTVAGDPVKLANVFPVRTLDEVPQAIADIRCLFAGSEVLKPIPVSLPLRRILDVLELLLKTDPDKLRMVLYGDRRS